MAHEFLTSDAIMSKCKSGSDSGRIRESRSGRWVAVLAVLLFLACTTLIGHVMFKQLHTSNRLVQTASEAVEAADSLSEQRKKTILSAAIAYNSALAASGQPVIGESSIDGSSTGTSFSQTDSEYRSLLNMTDEGIMARIQIPSISVDLPVYHGTSDSALVNGAGHLYGTSLPVHAPDTNAVLSAHSGQISATMFLRLGELRKGDLLYVQSFGVTNGYRVDTIEVIQPEDASLYRVKMGEERLTLMTCWPVGINTERLVVSGRWHEIPDMNPILKDAARGSHIYWYVTAVVLITGVLGVLVTLWLRRRVYEDGQVEKAS